MKTPSTVLLLVAVAQIVLGGVLGLGWGPIPAGGMGGVALGVVLITWFVVRMLRSAHPIFDPRVLARPSVRGTSLALFASYVVLTGGILGIVMMRMVIGQLLAIVEKYPPLVDGAFIIIAWVGIKLLVEYLGEKYPVTVARVGAKPLFDPENDRIMS